MTCIGGHAGPAEHLVPPLMIFLLINQYNINTLQQNMMCSCQNMRVSINGGTSKSSTLIGFSLINHPFWGTPVPPFMETPKWEPQLPSIKHPALTSPRCLGARRCGLRSKEEPHHPQRLGAGQQDGLVFKNGPLLCLMWKIQWKVLK